MSTKAPFNVIVVVSYYKLRNFKSMRQAAAVTVVDRTSFGVEVIVKTAIMGSDPIMSGSLTLCGFGGGGAMGDLTGT
jgi:hypothetical protein